jgi:hypothetical protein
MRNTTDFKINSKEEDLHSLSRLQKLTSQTVIQTFEAYHTRYRNH